MSQFRDHIIQSILFLEKTIHHNRSRCKKVHARQCLEPRIVPSGVEGSLELRVKCGAMPPHSCDDNTSDVCCQTLFFSFSLSFLPSINPSMHPKIPLSFSPFFSRDAS